MGALRIASGLVALACAGCSGSVKAVVNEPSSITLETALVESVDALHAASDRAATYGTRIGLNPCTLQAVFNVTASATGKQGLVLNVGAPAGAPVNITVGGTAEQTQSATRGNTVTVTFNSPACNPPGTLGSSDPAQVSVLQQQIAAAAQGAILVLAVPATPKPGSGGKTAGQPKPRLVPGIPGGRPQWLYVYPAGGEGLPTVREVTPAKPTPVAP